MKEDLKHLLFFLGGTVHLAVLFIVACIGTSRVTSVLQRMSDPMITNATERGVLPTTAGVVGIVIGIVLCVIAGFAALYEWGDHFYNFGSETYAPVYFLWGAFAPPISAARWIDDHIPVFAETAKILRGKF